MTAPRCAKCGADPNQTAGYLARANAKGQPAVWECRPSCMAAPMGAADRIMGAIEGDES